MKKVALIFALVFMAFVNANEITNNNATTTNREVSRYNYNQPIKFIERGIAFFVFPNGEFDFNTHPRYHRSNYRRSNVQVNINTTYGAPRSSYHHPRGIRIEHDHLGRVRRIGNVFINYDRIGRIKRVGSVYMNYHHHLLANIGGLYLFYNRHHQIIRTTGSIKRDIGCHFCGAFSCTINHYDNHNNGGHHHNNDWNNDDWDDDTGYGNDDDMYYYKSQKNNKTKKRRKH